MNGAKADTPSSRMTSNNILITFLKSLMSVDVIMFVGIVLSTIIHKLKLLILH